MIDPPEIVAVPARTAAVVNVTVPRADVRTVVGPALGELHAALAAAGVRPSGPWYMRHLRVTPATFEFDVGVPVATPIAPTGRVTMGGLPATTVARTVLRGGYEGLGPAWGELDAWVREAGRSPTSERWETFTVGPETTKDAGEWETELMRPLDTAGGA